MRHCRCLDKIMNLASTSPKKHKRNRQMPSEFEAQAETLMKFTFIFTIYLVRSFALLMGDVHKRRAHYHIEFQRLFINQIEMNQKYKHFIYVTRERIQAASVSGFIWIWFTIVTKASQWIWWIFANTIKWTDSLRLLFLVSFRFWI